MTTTTKLTLFQDAEDIEGRMLAYRNRHELHDVIDAIHVSVAVVGEAGEPVTVFRARARVGGVQQESTTHSDFSRATHADVIGGRIIAAMDLMLGLLARDAWRRAHQERRAVAIATRMERPLRIAGDGHDPGDEDHHDGAGPAPGAAPGAGHGAVRRAADDADAALERRALDRVGLDLALAPQQVS